MQDSDNSPNVQNEFFANAKWTTWLRSFEGYIEHLETLSGFLNLEMKLHIRIKNDLQKRSCEHKYIIKR